MFYDFLIFLAGGCTKLAVHFSPKIQLWVAGRKNWRTRFAQNFSKKGKVLWVHVSSLGEFEQGRPVIETFRERFPGWQIVLTFFSPSGFEIRKNYAHADFVAYLPLDSRRNVRDFLDLVQPDTAIFVKYDFWRNYLAALKKRGVPTILVSAVFRKNQPFFKFYGNFWRQMLACFSHIFVQDLKSQNLLQTIGFQNVTVAGDTRIDRVLAIVETAPSNEKVLHFLKNNDHPVFIVGSSWPEDEAIYLPIFQKNLGKNKLIIAPHDIQNLSRFENLPGMIFYSKFNFQEKNQAQILVIDNIGLLNSLYQYADVAWIGGGFGRGIHNILEPAAFGLPIIFGPNFQKFEEAKQLLASSGAFLVKNESDFQEIMEQLAEPDFRKKAGQSAKNWLLENRGATEKVISFLEKAV